MTPEINAMYKKMDAVINMIGPFLMAINPDELIEFEDKSRPFANGTMAPIALHYMNTQELRKTEECLNHARKVSKCLRELRSLLLEGMT